MTDLDAVRARGIPRDEALCRRLAGRIEPVWGFVAYGVLWVFIAGMISMGPLMGGIAVLGEHAQRWAVNLVLAAWGASFLVCWVPFGIWVSRRRGAARRLFRDGEMIDAEIVDVAFHTLRNAPFTRANLTFVAGGVTRASAMSVGGHHRELVPGARAPVLFDPRYRYCAVFQPDGSAVAASY